MIERNDQITTYEHYGYTRAGVKKDAPIFVQEPITYKEAKLGENIIQTISNLDAGVVSRGSLSLKARASPYVIHLSDIPYQVSSAVSKFLTNLIAAQGGTTTQKIDRFTMYQEFPIKDGILTYNSGLTSRGITLDKDYIYFAAGTNLYRVPHDLSSVTQITGTISGFNGLASDGVYLYTVNGTSFHKITISGTTFSVSTTTLSFSLAKLGGFDGKHFIGYDSTNNLLRIFDKSGIIWKNLPYLEPSFLGGITFQGFFYVATQIGSTNDVQLVPILI